MSNKITEGACGTTEACYAQQAKVPFTVRNAYDEEIHRLKIRLEQVTIAKAKAETLGMLDYPVGDLRNVLGYVI